MRPRGTLYTRAGSFSTNANSQIVTSDGYQITPSMVVPANTTATVYVPARSLADITEDGEPVANAEDVKCLRVENGKAVFEVGSGIYHFGSAMVSVQEVSSPAVTQVTESNLK